MNKQDKATIRRRLRDKVRWGLIEIPIKCEICNLISIIESHHPNYLEPERYIWVCKKCHSTIHKGFKYDTEGNKIK